MKVLFHMRNPVYVRNFEHTIRLLAEHGHTVHVAFEESKKGWHEPFRTVESLAFELDGVTWGQAPTAERSPTFALATELRSARSFLRYLDSEYADAHKLRERARRAAPPAIPALTASRWGRRPAARAALGRVVRRFEAALPPHPRIVDYLREWAPDALLVTPLVQFGSTQTDYVRAARGLGIPSALCVFSWDNLTNKGLMHEVPDLVTVWNDAQRDEAVRMQDVPAERVAVTGAVAYDHWFTWQPAASRAEFCGRLGLPADEPLLLYLCSSAFIAPKEVTFVRRWLAELRAGGPLSGAGVLVRPHPMNASEWRDADLSDLGPVAVHPRAGADPRDRSAREDYYDAIHHSAAVVGVNTSAQIEAAIVGRPVHTVLDPEFRDTQSGTLHFSHLTDAGGGLLHVAPDWRSHLEMVQRTITDHEGTAMRNRRFLEAFVRPFGLDEPASPRLAAAIEALAGTDVPRAGWSRGVGDRAVRRLEPLARRALATAAEETPPRPAPQGLDEIERAAVSALDAAVAGDGPVLAGPWISEVGFELLYWIPFLRWATDRHPGLAERLVAVSRGGATPWYEGVAGGYADVFDHLTPADLARLRGVGKQKQVKVTSWEEDVLAAVRTDLDLDRAPVLHPRLMYEPFKALFKLDAVARMQRILRPAPLGTPALDPALEALLPEAYVAVRFYWSHALPHHPETEQWVADAVRSLAANVPVVLLNSGMRLDDHSDVEQYGERVVRVDQLMTPTNNLSIQTHVASRARAFVGTYGGLSYLPCFLGVPSACFYTRDDLMNACHLDTAARTFRGPGYGSFLALRPQQADVLELLRADTAPRVEG